MANAFRKLTNGNKGTILADWQASPTNRTDILYFQLSEMDGKTLVTQAFGAGVLISYIPLDAYIGQITFLQILT